MSKLQDELIATKTQLNQVKAFTPDNPQIPALRNRMETLQGALDAEFQRMAGSGASLTNKAANYERLALDRAYADKQLAGALTALDAARSEAQRKQLYLERIVQPNLPDVAIEPRRFRSIIIVFVLGLVAWGILTLLVASVREHME
jgi:capsular polysaccharide transport system permease protein